MSENELFCCPTFVPAGTDENDFCLPKACLEKLPDQDKYPSPNSCLPKRELEVVKESIEAANQLLLNLALADRYTNREVWQRTFKTLYHQYVTIITDSKQFSEVCGNVKLTGFDFVLVCDDEKDILVPYTHISRIIVAERNCSMHRHTPELSSIEACFRRKLTFCFGNTVADSPELIQLFFGIPLSVYLLQYLDEKVVVLLDEKRLIGKLCSVTQEWLTIREKQKDVVVSLNQILAMSIKGK